MILGALPFFDVIGDYGSIFALLGSNFDVFFTQVIRMFFLAFTVNFLQDLTRGASQKPLAWFFFQCLVVFASMLINFGATYLARRFLPQGLVTWTPRLVFILVGLVLLLLLVKALFKIALFFTNPVFTAIFSFFTDSLLGKSLTKAFITTVGLYAIVCLLDWMGFTVLGAISLSLTAFVPMAILLFLIWYVVYRLLC